VAKVQRDKVGHKESESFMPMCLCAYVPFRRAFTLVEMMVVVAIIAVLIMLSLPFMHNARERARSAACQNNLRQYGIAMAKYMSDWKGYFIYPGEGTEKIQSYEGYDQSKYAGGLWRDLDGVDAASAAQYWGDDFIDKYLPKIASTNFAYLMASVQSVRICPAVQMELKSGNYLDASSPNFKGFRQDTVNGVDCEVADWEELAGNGGYDDAGNLILEEYFSTYAINDNIGVYNADRTNIANNTVAFIDWNAREGWRSCLYRSTNIWYFTSLDGKIQQGGAKWTTNWCLTEVGFHHKSGTNAYANYVAMDGHVASVSSNEISLSYFSAAGP